MVVDEPPPPIVQATRFAKSRGLGARASLATIAALAACEPRRDVPSQVPAVTISAAAPGAAEPAERPARLACPPPDPVLLEPDDLPPWERDPLGLHPSCIETADGARIRAEKDATDPDGWRVFLVAEDARGTRFRLATRALWEMALASDGSVVVAHTEDKVSRVSPGGEVLWTTPHPRCGAAQVSVGHAGEVVLGCGFSLLKLTGDGRFLWQKWPFGNTSMGKPLLLRDGTIVVSGGGAVAALDADGEKKWRLETGWNRYVTRLGVRPGGDLVFRTVMAELHSDGPIRFYYPSEPPELFVVSRGGEVVSREQVARRPEKGWPASLPWTPDYRAGRVP
jgi:hypothetical protein